MGDKTRGIYEKFEVRRTDGTSAPGAKHDSCEYFVLDLTHDPLAIPAIAAYAKAARKAGYKLLADDLEKKVARERAGNALRSSMEPDSRRP